MNDASFVISNHNKLDDRIKWCVDNINTDNITFEIDNDGKLIAHGNVVIPMHIEELPVKIDIVYGNVILENTLHHINGHFKSLKNFPDEVHGAINISMNPDIISLKGCPRKIGKSLICNNCSLANFDGIADFIGGNLVAFCNKINNIELLAQSTIKGGIDLYGNKDIDYFNSSAYKKMFEKIDY